MVVDPGGIERFGQSEAAEIAAVRAADRGDAALDVAAADQKDQHVVDAIAMHALGRGLAALAAAGLDAELVHLDVPGADGGQALEQHAAGVEDRCHRRAGGDRGQHGIEPAGDAAVQRVVVAALIVRLLGLDSTDSRFAQNGAPVIFRNVVAVSSVSQTDRWRAGVRKRVGTAAFSNLIQKQGLARSKRFFCCLHSCGLTGVIAVVLAGAGSHAAGAADQPSAWGFDTANCDKTCKPCDDFYQFAMGGWMKSNPIPPEYPSWGTFAQLADKNQQNLKLILEYAAAAKAAPGSNEQKIGDFYASCMDATAIDSAGVKPLEPELARIAAIKNLTDLQAEAERLHSKRIGALFRFGSNQDAKDSTHVIGGAFQGGLGLPEREYYLKSDDKSKQSLREKVNNKHVAKMFELLGDPADQSDAEAAVILKIETGAGNPPFHGKIRTSAIRTRPTTR